MPVSLMTVVCCQVEVSATGRSLVQRRPTECYVCVYVCVCVCDHEVSKNRRLWPTRGCRAMEKKIISDVRIVLASA